MRRTPRFRILVATLLTLTLLALLCFAGCASGGLLSMSDDWCHAHPDASAARCAQ